MHGFEGIEHLRQDEHQFLLRHGLACPLHALREAFAIHQVHHVVGGAVLVEEVMHTDDVWIDQLAQTLRLFLELLLLGSEGALVLRQADGDVGTVALTAAHPFDVEFLAAINDCQQYLFIKVFYCFFDFFLCHNFFK